MAGRERIAGEPAIGPSTRAASTADGRDAILARIRPTADLAAAGDADLVVEAVFEDLAVKHDALAGSRRSRPDRRDLRHEHQLDRDPPTRRGRSTRASPPAFIGMHFFSPVPVMPLVELIRAHETTDATVEVVRALAAELGKQVIVSADRPGFIVNRILMPFLAEAMRAFEQGVGTAEDIDAGARVGLNHPMGPLELADFIGLDVCLGIMRVLHDGLGEDHLRPPRVLEELVAAGHLGQKTGRGFYTYPRG